MASGPPRPPDRGPLVAPLPYIPPPDPEFGTIPQQPAPPPYPGYMSPQDLAAMAMQTIQNAYAPQLQYLQSQAKQTQQMHAAQQAGLVELYKILAGSMGGLGGQVGDIYNQGAQNIGNYTQGVVSNDLPLEQQIVSSGAAQGPGYGSAYPQLAGQQGQTEFLKAVQEGRAAEQDIGSQIQALVAQEPEKVQSLLQQLQGQQADYAKAAQPIIRSAGGAIVAIDPLTGKTQVLYKGTGAAGRVTIRSLANGQLQAFDETGRPVGKPYGPTRAAGGTRLTFQTVAGRRVGIDPLTGEIKVDYGPAGTKSTKPSNLQVKTIPINGVNHQVAINPRNGKVVVDYGPTRKTGVGPGSGVMGPDGKPLSAAAYKGYAQDTIATINDALSTKRYDPTTKTWVKHVPASIGTIMDALRHSPIPEGVWRPVLAKKLGVPSWAVKGVTSTAQMSQLRNMGFTRLRSIAAFLGYEPPPGTVPGKTGATKQDLIQWIQAHVPKASAAATGGTRAAYNARAARVNTQPIPREAWPSMIRAAAENYRLDAAAVLAVAQAEGLGGGVGDNGTSFGPFQLHIGGALPRGKDQTWAESPAGIDYALRKIASVARGKTGRAAVEAIVRLFERPSDPAGEIARALAYYENWATV